MKETGYTTTFLPLSGTSETKPKETGYVKEDLIGKDVYGLGGGVS